MVSIEEERPTLSDATFSKDEVNKLMSQGKRHFVCDEIVEATKCFETACFMLNNKYGALSNECGDVHFQYGKSLLELARLENGVLGSAIKEAEEEEDSDGDSNMGTDEYESSAVPDSNASVANDKKPASEKTTDSAREEMVEDRNKDKMEKSSDDDKVKQENVSENTSEDTKESMSEEKKEVDEAVREESEEKKEDGVKETGSKDGRQENVTQQQEGQRTTENEQENDTKSNDKDINADSDETKDDGPVSTIQLAWETLEIARIIFQRNNSTEIQLKLAQTHLLLGEIHMEQEQFSGAVSELMKCLNIQKNLLKPDDRLLAETYYNLGLAYTFSMLYEESASHYANATEVLELRLKNIKSRIEVAEEQDKGKGKALDDDPLVKDRKEVAELEELLPEIKEKCLDAKNEMERLKSNMKEMLGFGSFGGESTSFPCSSSSGDTAKPANDISHLVRKQKRKSKEDEESAESSENPTKKQRQDEQSTTTHAQNGDSAQSKAGTSVENAS